MRQLFWTGLAILLIIGLFIIPDFREPALYLYGIYGQLDVKGLQPEVVYNPGLRTLPKPADSYKIWTVIPHGERTHIQEINAFKKSGANVIVECSGLDTWHTGKTGSSILADIRQQAYRIVIFDGGHHLPTIGLEPDIIIAPVWRGYIAHGYMRDGIRVEQLRQLLEENNSSSILITVPRWRVVKEASSLEKVTRRCLEKVDGETNKPTEELEIQSRLRLTRKGSFFYTYVNRVFVEHPQQLIEGCQELGLEGMECIYVAFDFSTITEEEADEYLRMLENQLGIEARRVNDNISIPMLFKPSTWFTF